MFFFILYVELRGEDVPISFVMSFTPWVQTSCLAPGRLKPWLQKTFTTTNFFRVRLSTIRYSNQPRLLGKMQRWNTWKWFIRNISLIGEILCNHLLFVSALRHRSMWLRFLSPPQVHDYNVVIITVNNSVTCCTFCTRWGHV